MIGTLLHQPETEDATRRQFLGLLAAAGLLTACGADNDPASARTAGTRTVSTPYGDQLVPLAPQRVMTLEGRRDFETMVALGLVPVAAGHQGDRAQPFARFIDVDVSDVELAFRANMENVETIARIRPDLIVGRNVEDLDTLDQILALVPVLSVAAQGDWKADLRAIGAAVGRQQQAEARLAEYEQRLAQVRDRYAEAIDTARIGIFQYSPSEGGLSWSAPRGFYLQSQVLTDLGGTFPDFLAADGNDTFEGLAEASPEQLGQLSDADAFLVIANVLVDRGVDDVAALEADPLWNRLPAVQAGRVVVTDFKTNYGSYYAALAALRLIEQTYDTLADA